MRPLGLHLGMQRRNKGNYGDKTVIEVTVSSDDLSFAFGRWAAWGYSVSGLQGHSEFTVDWGDGTSDTFTGLQYHNNNTAIYPQHTYPQAGTYVMTISNDLECFNLCKNTKVTRLIQWGKDVTYGCHYSYRSAASNMSTFYDCINMVGEVPPFPEGMVAAFGTFGNTKVSGAIPKWNNAIKDVGHCYYGCSGLLGAIPEWNEKIVNVTSCYYGCRGLSGTIPEWNKAITNAGYCYHSCSGLSGTIPEWNEAIKDVGYCYHSCSGLSGAIPKWNEAITLAANCYHSCSGLSGAIPEWNEYITSASGCYNGCRGLSGVIPKWNDAITSAVSCYRDCSGLSGTIPKWNEAIKDVGSCYRGCRGLSGIWDESATDEEIQPSHITSFSNCVSDTSSALRQYFYTTWGGTKAVPA